LCIDEMSNCRVLLVAYISTFMFNFYSIDKVVINTTIITH
jgi:hypothetical protein